MTAVAVQMVWAWVRAQPRWLRLWVRVMLATQVVMIAAMLLAPHACAAGLDAVLGFTGVRDSYGVPLSSVMYVNADDALFDWNGVLPRVHAGTSVSAGIANAVGAAETSFIVITVSLMLWLMRALQATFWNDLFGSVFSAVGFSLDKVLSSAPFVGLGLVAGTFAGVLMIGAGRYTAARTTIAATWIIGTLGLALGHDLLGKLLAPQGWVNQVHSVATGVAGTLMSRGQAISSGSTSVDARFGQLQTGFADATRQALQQWMLGRVVDRPPSDLSQADPTQVDPAAACSAAWTSGQLSGDPQQLVTDLTNGCPPDVVAHIQHVSMLEGLFVWVVLAGCLAVGAWFAWCGLNCLFRVLFYGGFAVAFVVYGVFPGFPRRFLKLAATDFLTQLLSYGIYFVLTGVYVLVLLSVWSIHISGFGAVSAVARLTVTAIVMMLFVAAVRHVRKLHQMATSVPPAEHVTPARMAAPVMAAAGMSAAAGLSAFSAAGGRAGGAGRGGGSGPVSNRSTSGRINAGLAAAQSALSFAHPAAAAVGAVAGGFGSAGVGALRARSAARDGAEGRSGPSGGQGPGGPAGSRPTGAAPSAPGPGRDGADPSAMSAQRAQKVRQDAAAIARQAALQRPGSAPVTGAGGSGLNPR